MRLNATARWVAGKIGTSALTLLFVLVFNFFLFRMLPGDPIKTYTRGRSISPTQLAALRHSLHLDQSMLVQFLTYMKNPFNTQVLSLQFQQPVYEVIGSRVWPTVLLLGTSTILATVIGVWIGIKGAWNRGSRFDKSAMTTSIVLYAMPGFWLGMLLLILFSAGIGPFPGIFPSGGMSSVLTTSGFASFLDTAKHAALPVLTLTLSYLAEYALVMRSSLIDEMGSDYLVTAKAKGLRDAMVRRRHAVPNAFLPTLTLIFLNLGFVIGGAITVESVFSWPGLGMLTYQALRGPDVPLLQAIFLVISVGVVVANLFADLLYGVLDPRVRTA